jgi:hypothetical protein
VRVGFLVVAFPIVFSFVGDDTVPRVDHLKNTQKNGGRGKNSGKSTEVRYN